MTQRIMIAGLVSVGFQEITLADSTAIGLDSTTLPSSLLDISIETNSARFRADGTDPTLTTGVLLPQNSIYRFEGVGGLSALKFQRSTGSCVVSIQAWKHIGDKAN